MKNNNTTVDKINLLKTQRVVMKQPIDVNTENAKQFLLAGIGFLLVSTVFLVFVVISFMYSDTDISILEYLKGSFFMVITGLAFFFGLSGLVISFLLYVVVLIKYFINDKRNAKLQNIDLQISVLNKEIIEERNSKIRALLVSKFGDFVQEINFFDQNDEMYAKIIVHNCIYVFDTIKVGEDQLEGYLLESDTIDGLTKSSKILFNLGLVGEL